MKKKRREFKEKINNLTLSELIYIDESGMNDNDFCPYAYAETGKRYYESRPGHYKKELA